MHSSSDIAMMHHALRLANRHVGNTGPNPSVGCVIVKGGQIIATGITAIGGRPHAETTALEKAGTKAKDATMFVTLEPCAHTGETPPCVDAVIKAGIARVVIGCTDSDKRVSGKAIQTLKDANIAVEVGVCEKEAREANAGFFKRIEQNKPYVSMKLATTLDGKIANEKNESQWITGDLARHYGHLLRSKHDAILTGIGTAQADNPSLTCRIAGLQSRSPIRIILDAKGELSPDNTLVQTAGDTPTWVITSEAHERQWSDSTVETLIAPMKDDHINLDATLTLLAERGINRVMVEAGSGLSTAFIKQQLVDELYWFTNPSLIGNAGLAAIGALDAIAPSDLARWQHQQSISLGEDVCNLYRVAA